MIFSWDLKRIINNKNTWHRKRGRVTKERRSKWVCDWAYSTKSAVSFIKNELLKGHTPKFLYFYI